MARYLAKMLDNSNFNSFKQQVIAFFNSRTEYDKGNICHPLYANRLLELAQLQTGQKVLDVATGTGLVAIAAAQTVTPIGHVIGVDISSGMLRQAQQKMESASLHNLELIEADADDLNFRANSFDVILCSSAIVWFSNIPGVLRSWHCFLKPGGLLAFNCFAETAFPPSVLFRKVARKYGIKVPNPNQLLGTPERCYQLLQEVGFKDIEVKTEQFGSYCRLEASSAEAWWRGNSNSGFGFQVFQLEAEKLEQCKAEYFIELETLATEQGIWNDITTFFLLARK